MKRNLFLAFVMTIALALALSFAVSAEETSVHNENTVDYSETVTLDDGTVCNLFDGEGNALIWYITATSDGINTYASIRADDSQVKWMTQSWGEVTAVKIVLDDGTTYSSGTFAVVNMMDDDVKSNTPIGTHTNYGKPITGFKQLFASCKNLEYVYLRLDTTAIYAKSFENASKLKYINLENLTKLTRIGDGRNFVGCTSLFKDEVLDLSKTKLTSIDGEDSFRNVPFAKIIFPKTITTFGKSFRYSGLGSITFPTTITTIPSGMLTGCQSLTSVYLNSNLASINDSVFLECTALSKIFYTGTQEDLNKLLDSTSTTDNDPFWSVVGENRENVISYENYLALEDKSGAYVVYNYVHCGYNDTNHDFVASNACLGFCDECGKKSVSHTEQENVSIKIEYADYAKAGVKTTVCKNKGCKNKSVTEAPAFIVCLGYSVPENGREEIAVGYKVNNKAVEEYESIMGKAVSYGVFAVLEEKLGDSDVFDESGVVADGVITTEISESAYVAFKLKISGFTDAQKSERLAMGAYVSVSGDEATKYTYIQSQAPSEGEKYFFASYNDVVALTKDDED